MYLPRDHKLEGALRSRVIVVFLDQTFVLGVKKTVSTCTYICEFRGCCPKWKSCNEYGA